MKTRRHSNNSSKEFFESTWEGLSWDEFNQALLSHTSAGIIRGKIWRVLENGDHMPMSHTTFNNWKARIKDADHM